jgi:hypothetical protein
VIAPASERQIVRARLEDRYLVRETGAMYSKGLKPMIEELRRDGRSIQWVYNILDGKKETERSGGPSLRQVVCAMLNWSLHLDTAGSRSKTVTR